MAVLAEVQDQLTDKQLLERVAYWRYRHQVALMKIANVEKQVEWDVPNLRTNRLTKEERLANLRKSAAEAYETARGVQMGIEYCKGFTFVDDNEDFIVARVAKLHQIEAKKQARKGA